MIIENGRIIVPLQPLRIPAGWTVRYNSFCELDPSALTDEEACYVLHEDLLLVERESLRLRLGWYGRRIDGRYRLRKQRIPSLEVLLDAEFNSTLEAVRRLEEMLVTG